MCRQLCARGSPHNLRISPQRVSEGWRRPLWTSPEPARSFYVNGTGRVSRVVHALVGRGERPITRPQTYASALLLHWLRMNSASWLPFAIVEVTRTSVPFRGSNRKPSTTPTSVSATVLGSTWNDSVTPALSLMMSRC